MFLQANAQRPPAPLPVWCPHSEIRRVPPSRRRRIRRLPGVGLLLCFSACAPARLIIGIRNRVVIIPGRSLQISRRRAVTVPRKSGFTNHRSESLRRREEQFPLSSPGTTSLSKQVRPEPSRRMKGNSLSLRASSENLSEFQHKKSDRVQIQYRAAPSEG